MSTISAGQVYPGQGFGVMQTALDSASAGGPSADMAKLPMASWIALVVLLIVGRLVWEASD